MKTITNSTSAQPQGTATAGSKNPQRTDTGKTLPVGSSAFTSVRLNAAGFTIAGMRASTTRPQRAYRQTNNSTRTTTRPTKCLRRATAPKAPNARKATKLRPILKRTKLTGTPSAFSADKKRKRVTWVNTYKPVQTSDAKAYLSYLKTHCKFGPLQPNSPYASATVASPLPPFTQTSTSQLMNALCEGKTEVDILDYFDEEGKLISEPKSVKFDQQEPFIAKEPRIGY